jgi:hypothetical protein
LRSKESFSNDLEQQKISKVVQINGVKNAPFLETHYFKCLDSCPLDVMHDILEGVARVTFSCLMQELSKLKLYKNNQLNNDVISFKYGRIDKKKKVPAIFQENCSFKLSASSMWTLMRIFPLIVGENFKGIDHFKDKIKRYLELFIKNNPSSKLTPKQHFLTHYPSVIRKCGPARNYSTIRFESKHSYFKKVNSATHNHINLSKSLATRHQLMQVYHSLSPQYYDDMIPGTGIIVDNISLSFAQIQLNCTNFFKNFTIRGILYEIGDVLKIKKPTYQYLQTFGLIKNVTLKEQEIVFRIKPLETTSALIL